jgi:hypothetical protein
MKIGNDKSKNGKLGGKGTPTAVKKLKVTNSSAKESTVKVKPPKKQK